MSWIVRKLDSLIGTIVAATAGLAASQAQAFTAAYLQRLGGHLDEARLNLARLASNADGTAMTAEIRASLVGAAERRVAELGQAYDAIAGTDALLRPAVLLRELDPAIAEAAFRIFQPALPLDTASMITALLGMILGWAIYQLVTAPLRLIARRPRAYRY